MSTRVICALRCVISPSSVRSPKGRLAQPMPPVSRTKYWEFHNAMFEGGEHPPKSELDDDSLVSTAKDLGLDPTKFKGDMNSVDAHEEFEANAQESYFPGRGQHPDVRHRRQTPRGRAADQGIRRFRRRCPRRGGRVRRRATTVHRLGGSAPHRSPLSFRSALALGSVRGHSHPSRARQAHKLRVSTAGEAASVESW